MSTYKVYGAYKPCEKPKPPIVGLDWYEDEIGYYALIGELKPTTE